MINWKLYVKVYILFTTQFARLAHVHHTETTAEKSNHNRAAKICEQYNLYHRVLNEKEKTKIVVITNMLNEQ